jgi:2-oxoglutarate ferredoxin oxidoreductase subunit gamma
MYRDKIIIAGAGGQGALRIGQMIAYAALMENKEATWLPSYGAEMRGGTANCSVIVSDEEIPLPIVSEPEYCLVMNHLSLNKFECQVRPGGAIIVNTSLIHKKVERDDLKTYYIPADNIAEEEGNSRGANMVMLGAYIAVSGNISIESIYDVVEKTFTGSKKKYVNSNKQLVKRGFDYTHSLKV